ncbi:MAG: nucleotidyl transferase AbiEii/AbiGii toxin family protein [Deltaproteobacteria bacterium]|nr:nucleotidyl transferase AbiEii/AbiGii toxin family protein [Deltaproteobacteria bacterium]
MNVRLQYLERCSAQTGYPVPLLEKVVRLGEMAGDVARHPFLSSVLALKGGTALNLCFGPPKRLSVDLDFNYTGHRDREKMLTIDRKWSKLSPNSQGARGTGFNSHGMPLPGAKSI